MAGARTTLTLEPDVAEALERLRRKEDLTLKEAVNRALRLGLDRLDRPARPRKFETRAVSLKPLAADVDDIAEVLAVAEGDGFR